MTKFLTKFRRSEEGATAIEYGLIAALVAIALITALGNLGDSLESVFTSATTELNNASTTTSSTTTTTTPTP